jgi:hypothetical protein
MATLGTFTTGQVLTAAELNAIGTWTTFTPSWTNFTPGSATQDCRYCIVNKIMFVQVRVTLNSSTMGTAPRLTIPDSKTALNQTHVLARQVDSGTDTYLGWARADGTSITMGATLVSGSYIQERDVTATVPMTWATNDRFEFLVIFPIS